MSHIPQRKERDCLNCGTIVQGKYCQNCGQENVVTHETFWHMVTHFFYDITHFDTNFFSTVKYLLFKPGFLSNEYNKGKRASYLHPIKMYVFTSAIFFLLFFSFFGPNLNTANTGDNPLTSKERAAFIRQLQQELQKDSGNINLKNKLALFLDTSKVVTSSDLVKDSVKKEEGVKITFGDSDYMSWEQYDSLQKLLPSSDRDGWVVRRLQKLQINLETAYRKDPNGTIKHFVNTLLHKLPYMLFISLPLFALILQLVYIRRKQFFYADHGVFTLHLYIFSFILLLTVFSIDKLEDATKWGSLEFVQALLFLLLFFYLYKAMRKFYGQRRGKTFLKFLLVAILSLVMMLVLFTIFIFFSAASI
ncbi:MAG: DUF3667 domain-containing protein [Chitinophagaceae bacterium]